MELSKHVRKALSEYEAADFDSALMHACFAIDATARKFYGTDKIGKKKYKALITQYIWLVEAMLGYGINLDETRWTNVSLDDGSGNNINDPLFADIIYHIHRCNHAHGKEVPKNYSLLPPSGRTLRWEVGGGVIRMPQHVILALISVSVFCGANSDIAAGNQEWLSLGRDKFLVKEWWGKEERFESLLKNKVPNPTRVKFDLKAIQPTAGGIFVVTVHPPTETCTVLLDRKNARTMAQSLISKIFRKLN